MLREVEVLSRTFSQSVLEGASSFKLGYASNYISLKWCSKIIRSITCQGVNSEDAVFSEVSPFLDLVLGNDERQVG